MHGDGTASGVGAREGKTAYHRYGGCCEDSDAVSRATKQTFSGHMGESSAATRHPPADHEPQAEGAGRMGNGDDGSVCLACVAFHVVPPANQRRAIGLAGTTAKIVGSAGGACPVRGAAVGKRAGFRIVWKANLLRRPTARQGEMTGLKPDHEVGEEK